MTDKILIEKHQLLQLIEYVNSISDFIDTESVSTVAIVKSGYDDFVKPVFDLLNSDQHINTRFDALRQLPIEEVSKILGDADFCFDKCIDDKSDKYFKDGKCQCALCWREYLEGQYKGT